MNRLPSSQRYKRHVDRWKRYEKPRPHPLQECAPIGGIITAARGPFFTVRSV